MTSIISFGFGTIFILLYGAAASYIRCDGLRPVIISSALGHTSLSNGIYSFKNTSIAVSVCNALIAPDIINL